MKKGPGMTPEPVVDSFQPVRTGSRHLSARPEPPSSGVGPSKKREPFPSVWREPPGGLFLYPSSPHFQNCFLRCLVQIVSLGGEPAGWLMLDSRPARDLCWSRQLVCIRRRSLFIAEGRGIMALIAGLGSCFKWFPLGTEVWAGHAGAGAFTRDGDQD